MKYQYKKYDKAYPILAKVESKRIGQVLPQAEIIHFGSTAIPKMGGKGIIDLYVLVEPDELTITSNSLCAQLEYEFRESGGNDERLFHQRYDGVGELKQIYHVHVGYEKSRDYIDSIRFRNELRNNASLRLEYKEAKLRAVEKVKNIRNKKMQKKVYMDVKGIIIDQFESKLN